MPLVVVWDNSLSMQRQLLSEEEDPDGSTNLFNLSANILSSFFTCLTSVYPNEQVALMQDPCYFNSSSLTEFVAVGDQLIETWKQLLTPTGGLFDIYSTLTKLCDQFQSSWMSSSTPMDLLIVTDGGSQLSFVNPLFESSNRSGKTKWSKKLTSKLTICSFNNKLNRDLEDLRRSQRPSSRVFHLDVDDLLSSLSSTTNDGKISQNLSEIISQWSRKIANNLIFGSNFHDYDSLPPPLPLSTSSTTSVNATNSSDVWINTDDSCFTVCLADIKSVNSTTCCASVQICPPLLFPPSPQRGPLTQPVNTSTITKWVDPAVRNNEIEIEIVGFLNHSDVKSPHVSSRHILWPVKFDNATHRWAPANNSNEPHFINLLRLALVGTTQLTALCAVNLINHSLPLCTDPPSGSICVDEPMRWAFVSAAAPKVAPKLMLFLLPENVNMVPWLGKLSFLAPISLFDTSPYRDEDHVTPFPVCSSIRMSYSPHLPKPPFLVNPDANNEKQLLLEQLGKSWSVHTTWMNPTTAANEVIRFARMCRKMNENSIPMVYKELNRIRAAACVYAYDELLEHLTSTLQAEMNQFNQLGKDHSAFILKCLKEDPHKFIESDGLKS